MSFFGVMCVVACTSVGEPLPFGVIPSRQQVEWHQMEYNMFVHFGPNTFTGSEWGSGKEKAELFNPEDMDCRQWTSIAKAAGMNGVIITAKHHDGFCLWATKETDHCVTNTPFGKDIVKMLSESCKKYGLKLASLHNDCGLILYDSSRQDVHSGGSGCGCSAVVLSADILPKIKRGELSRILFMATGAMMSPSSIQQGFSIPAVAHLLRFSS